MAHIRWGMWFFLYFFKENWPCHITYNCTIYAATWVTKPVSWRRQPTWNNLLKQWIYIIMAYCLMLVGCHKVTVCTYTMALRHSFWCLFMEILSALMLIYLSTGLFQKHLWALKWRTLQDSPLNKIHIFQRIAKIFCAEFQRVPLKYQTQYLTHTLTWFG